MNIIPSSPMSPISLIFNLNHMKVQSRLENGYSQLYVTLPSKLCDAMGIEKGSEVKVEIGGKDSLKLRVRR